jgi:hypothetical protein
MSRAATPVTYMRVISGLSLGWDTDYSEVFLWSFSVPPGKFHDSAVKCIPIARQRLGKHIPAGGNAPRSRTPIARRWRGEHVSSTK